MGCVWVHAEEVASEALDSAAAHADDAAQPASDPVPKASGAAVLLTTGVWLSLNPVHVALVCMWHARQ